MKLLMVLILCMMIVGCGSANFCIKIEGSAGKYGIDDASVELCRNVALSAKENAEIYTSNTGEHFAITNLKYIERANEVIRKANTKESIKAASVGVGRMEQFCKK